ncbi:unnamed protein product [Parnassius mnemosyne]|uniref:DDE Tnp4 domain-containing protein n=1 Tax=Parnassius mnemosyne TaxID=213953 RepID=A0AAV1LQ61_9NEOP
MAPYLSKQQKIGLALAVVGTMDIKKKKKKCWVKEYLTLSKKLSNMNIVHILEPGDFRNFLRLDSNQFDYLLNLVSKHIEKEVTIFRESVSAKERLMVTLRFLTTGNSYQDLKYCSLISEPLISKLIPEICWAIYKCLKNYIQVPQSEEECSIAAQFESKWNFNNCVGACDGKHIAIQKPPGSGSLYYNYKGFFSVSIFCYR